MGIADNDIGTDEIRIGTEGYLNERLWFYSLYDEDPLDKAQKDSITPATEGLTAAPSQATALNFFGYENTHESEEESHIIGFYPLDGGKPFIDYLDRKLNGELPYANRDEFAFAVATRTLLYYGNIPLEKPKHEEQREEPKQKEQREKQEQAKENLRKRTYHTEQDIKYTLIDKIIDRKTRKELLKDEISLKGIDTKKVKLMYNLPDKFLAMNLLLCAKYCPDSLENYLSNNKDFMYHLIEACKIRYFILSPGTVKEKINSLERRKKEILPF